MPSVSFRVLAAAVLVLPVSSPAQGALSNQGFGYPGGQMSARALGSGGSLSEIDPLSATNPAAVLGFGGSALYFQAEPEYRTLHVGATKETSTIARYPLVAAAIPITESLLASLSVSNLLDRSFSTVTNGSQDVGGTIVTGRNSFTSDGAIGDVRLALAWGLQSWLTLGIAGHVITGDNRLNSTQTFTDSAFATLVDTTTVTYAGRAVSGGFQIRAPGALALAGSYRRGGSMFVKHADTTKATATVPDRLALSLAYLGIHGTSIAARAARDRWTNMRGLFSQPGARVTDGWDTSIGADVPGPRLFGSNLQVRGGGRWRTLPFGIPDQSGPTGITTGSDVKETSYSIGAGSLLARGRAALDVTGIHASRTATATSVTESAWTLSVGITVRP